MKISHLGSLVETTDAVRFDAFDGDTALGQIVAALESPGLLEPMDLARVRAILTKYTGNSGVTNGVGVTSAGDAADARDAADASARAAGAKVRAQVGHIAAVNLANRTFWDARNAELAASIPLRR
jgi:hypothetical protein